MNSSSVTWGILKESEALRKEWKLTWGSRWLLGRGNPREDAWVEEELGGCVCVCVCERALLNQCSLGGCVCVCVCVCVR